MGNWQRAPEPRDQLVMFPRRLDEVISPDHPVRLLHELLGEMDWSSWEARYHGRRGQPAIHPRILAGVLLYGLMCRTRSSRLLEEALLCRIDFRWLAEGHTADHTTISEFRRKFAEPLKDLFVQIGLLAQEMELTSLSRMGFDGSRMRANNRRSRARTPEELKQMQSELAKRFAELEAEAAREDANDQERFGDGAAHRLPEEFADIQRRQEKIAAALAELERIQNSDEKPPKRIPLTDPESRVTPNKEGGFAANFTPLAGVDIESGLIITADVIPGTDEEQHLLTAVETVEADFDVTLDEVLADGLFATGPNLAELEKKDVTLYSPSGAPKENPALRDDPMQPVPAQDHDKLPAKKVKGGGRQLDKAAFVYVAESDCYYCPQGRPLTRSQTTTDRRKDGTEIKRTRYKAAAVDCAACPLKAICLKGKATRREISRDQFEPHREKHAARMAAKGSWEKYTDRRHPGERPFGVIKQQFGARQFLLRGLERVRTEWTWMAAAFNLKHLIGHWSDRLKLHLSAVRPPPAVANPSLPP